MSEQESASAGERHSGRLIIPSLAVNYFAGQPGAIVRALLMVDIGLSLGVPVGIMGQLGAVGSIVGTIVLLFTGALSIRFRHKSLLMVSLTLSCISTLGYGLAPNFGVMLVVTVLGALGAFGGPMTPTLIGEHIPLEKRPSAFGWIFAGAAASYAIGAPVIAFIAGLGGWRLAYLGYALPLLLLGLFFVFIGLPSKSASIQPTVSKASYLKGYKEVITNRSASACLAGDLFQNAGWIAIVTYGASFFRQQFTASTGLVSIMYMGSAISYILGNLISGRLVNRFGRRPTTILAVLLAGVFTIFYTTLPNLWLCLAIDYLGCLFSGVVAVALSSLLIEQVPSFRGTMMSIDSAVVSVGGALGSGLGGLMILMFNYEFMSSSLGAMYIIGAMICYLFVIDPTRRSRQ